MKNKFNKSFNFYFTIFLLTLLIPFSITLDLSHGNSNFGLFAKIISVIEVLDNKITDLKYRFRKESLGDKKIIIVVQNVDRYNIYSTKGKLIDVGEKFIGIIKELHGVTNIKVKYTAN